jgi:hypothetical protein
MAMPHQTSGSGRARGVEMKRPVLLAIVATALGALAPAASAFQEGAPANTTERPPAAVAPVESQKAPAPGKGLSLKMPELSIGQGTGTEVRIPGFGKVGVLPKLDFGLELLYGATESKGLPEDKTEPGDVQIRGTIKHRF